MSSISIAPKVFQYAEEMAASVLQEELDMLFKFNGILSQAPKALKQSISQLAMTVPNVHFPILFKELVPRFPGTSEEKALLLETTLKILKYSEKLEASEYEKKLEYLLGLTQHKMEAPVVQTAFRKVLVWESFPQEWQTYAREKLLSTPVFKSLQKDVQYNTLVEVTYEASSLQEWEAHIDFLQLAAESISDLKHVKKILRWQTEARSPDTSPRAREVLEKSRQGTFNQLFSKVSNHELKKRYLTVPLKHVLMIQNILGEIGLESEKLLNRFIDAYEKSSDQESFLLSFMRCLNWRFSSDRILQQVEIWLALPPNDRPDLLKTLKEKLFKNGQKSPSLPPQPKSIVQESSSSSSSSYATAQSTETIASLKHSADLSPSFSLLVSSLTEKPATERETTLNLIRKLLGSADSEQKELFYRQCRNGMSIELLTALDVIARLFDVNLVNQCLVKWEMHQKNLKGDKDVQVFGVGVVEPLESKTDHQDELIVQLKPHFRTEAEAQTIAMLLHERNVRAFAPDLLEKIEKYPHEQRLKKAAELIFEQTLGPNQSIQEGIAEYLLRDVLDKDERAIASQLILRQQVAGSSAMQAGEKVTYSSKMMEMDLFSLNAHVRSIVSSLLRLSSNERMDTLRKQAEVTKPTTLRWNENLEVWKEKIQTPEEKKKAPVEEDKDPRVFEYSKQPLRNNEKPQPEFLVKKTAELFPLNQAHNTENHPRELEEALAELPDSIYAVLDTLIYDKGHRSGLWQADDKLKLPIIESAKSLPDSYALQLQTYLPDWFGEPLEVIASKIRKTIEDISNMDRSDHLQVEQKVEESGNSVFGGADRK